MLNMVFFLMALILVAFVILIERNLIRLSQIRKRPNIVGLWGVLQTILDRVKLLFKKIHLPLLKNFFYQTCYRYSSFFYNMVSSSISFFFFNYNTSTILLFFF